MERCDASQLADRQGPMNEKVDWVHSDASQLAALAEEPSARDVSSPAAVNAGTLFFLAQKSSY